MNRVLPKRTPVRLDSDFYQQQQLQVLRRDGWRCQSCGTMRNLEIHHKEFRSHSGDDSEQNLITLCNTCHTAIHRR
jgi:5-methylcytosine-specific restriction endonuclease McrA